MWTKDFQKTGIDLNMNQIRWNEAQIRRLLISFMLWRSVKCWLFTWTRLLGLSLIMKWDNFQTGKGTRNIQTEEKFLGRFSSLITESGKQLNKQSTEQECTWTWVLKQRNQWEDAGESRKHSQINLPHSPHRRKHSHFTAVWTGSSSSCRSLHLNSSLFCAELIRGSIKSHQVHSQSEGSEGTGSSLYSGLSDLQRRDWTLHKGCPDPFESPQAENTWSQDSSQRKLIWSFLKSGTERLIPLSSSNPKAATCEAVKCEFGLRGFQSEHVTERRTESRK